MLAIINSKFCRIIIVLTFGLFLCSGGWASRCVPAVLSLESEELFWKEAMGPLAEVRQKILDEYASLSKYDKGSKILVNGSEYEVIEFLGFGVHGFVYRVKDSRGNEFSLKDFHNQTWEHVIAQLKAYDDDGIPTVFLPTHEVDRVKRRSLQLYVHGAVVEDIVYRSKLTDKQKEDFHGLYIRWRDLYCLSKNRNCQIDNVVFDFVNKEFRVIDPF